MTVLSILKDTKIPLDKIYQNGTTDFALQLITYIKSLMWVQNVLKFIFSLQEGCLIFN